MKPARDLPSAEFIDRVAKRATEVANQVAQASYDHLKADSVSDGSGEAWLILRIGALTKLGRHLCEIKTPDVEVLKGKSPLSLQLKLPNFKPPGTGRITPQEDGLRAAAKIFEAELGWTVLISSKML